MEHRAATTKHAHAVSTSSRLSIYALLSSPSSQPSFLLLFVFFLFFSLSLFNQTHTLSREIQSYFGSCHHNTFDMSLEQSRARFYLMFHLMWQSLADSHYLHDDKVRIVRVQRNLIIFYSTALHFHRVFGKDNGTVFSAI